MPDHLQTSPYIARLTDSLAGAVAEGQIRLPRFVRWLDRIGSNASIEDSLTAGLETCNRVFGSKPAREHRTGDGNLHETVHAVWPNGASALISVGPGGAESESGPEIMLIGSSGAVYFDGTLSGTASISKASDR